MTLSKSELRTKWVNNMVYYLNTLSHHGILHQKWGVRNGPPYPLDKETRNRIRTENKLRALYKKKKKEKKSRTPFIDTIRTTWRDSPKGDESYMDRFDRERKRGEIGDDVYKRVEDIVYSVERRLVQKHDDIIKHKKEIKETLRKIGRKSTVINPILDTMEIMDEDVGMLINTEDYWDKH